MRRIYYLDTKILLETIELGCCHLTEDEIVFMIIRQGGLMKNPYCIYTVYIQPQRSALSVRTWSHSFLLPCHGTVPEIVGNPLAFCT